MAADYTRRLTSERAHGTFSDHAGGREHQTAADPRWRGARAVRGRRLHAGHPRAALLDGAVTATRTRGSHRGTRSRRCGIPSSAILTTSRAHTTHEEALEIRTLLTSRGIRKVMLLARAPGMARAMVVFKRA